MTRLSALRVDSNLLATTQNPNALIKTFYAPNLHRATLALI
jgi:hypothetical protein